MFDSTRRQSFSVSMPSRRLSASTTGAAAKLFLSSTSIASKRSSSGPKVRTCFVIQSRAVGRALSVMPWYLSDSVDR